MEINGEERDLLSLTTPGALGKRELHPQCLVASEVVALCKNRGENVWNQVFRGWLQLELQLLTEHSRAQASGSGFIREKKSGCA